MENETVIMDQFFENDASKAADTGKKFLFRDTGVYTKDDITHIAKSSISIPMYKVGENAIGDMRVLLAFKTGLLIGINQSGAFLGFYATVKAGDPPITPNKYVIYDGEMQDFGSASFLLDAVQSPITININMLKRVKVLGVV